MQAGRRARNISGNLRVTQVFEVYLRHVERLQARVEFSLVVVAVGWEVLLAKNVWICHTLAVQLFSVLDNSPPHSLAARVEQHFRALVARSDCCVAREVILPQHLLLPLLRPLAFMQQVAPEVLTQLDLVFLCCHSIGLRARVVRLMHRLQNTTLRQQCRKGQVHLGWGRAAAEGFSPTPPRAQWIGPESQGYL